MKIVKPESVDLNGERLKDLDKMFFDNYIGLNKLSCTQTLIARRGEIAHFHSQGKRDIESARDSVIIFNIIQFFWLNLQFTLIYGLVE